MLHKILFIKNVHQSFVALLGTCSFLITCAMFCLQSTCLSKEFRFICKSVMDYEGVRETDYAQRKQEKKCLEVVAV